MHLSGEVPIRANCIWPDWSVECLEFLIEFAIVFIKWLFGLAASCELEDKPAFSIWPQRYGHYNDLKGLFKSHPCHRIRPRFTIVNQGWFRRAGSQHLGGSASSTFQELILFSQLLAWWVGWVGCRNWMLWNFCNLTWDWARGAWLRASPRPWNSAQAD